MKVSITGKSENALLKRTELSFTVEDSAVPPSRKELREKIAALQNVPPEQVIVSKIGHGFGSKKVEGKARVYPSMELLERTELPHIVRRNMGEKKEKAEAAQAAENPAEKKETGREAGKPAQEGAGEKQEGKAVEKEKKEGE
jgi:ribosomal protein S24E